MVTEDAYDKCLSRSLGVAQGYPRVTGSSPDAGSADVSGPPETKCVRLVQPLEANHSSSTIGLAAQVPPKRLRENLVERNGS